MITLAHVTAVVHLGSLDANIERPTLLLRSPLTEEYPSDLNSVEMSCLGQRLILL